MHAAEQTRQTDDYAYDERWLQNLKSRLRNSADFSWVAQEDYQPLPYEISSPDHGTDFSEAIVVLSAFFLLAMPATTCMLIRSLAKGCEQSGPNRRSTKVRHQRFVRWASTTLRYALPLAAVVLALLLSLHAHWFACGLTLVVGLVAPKLADVFFRKSRVTGPWTAKQHWKPALVFCLIHLISAVALDTVLLHTYSQYSSRFPQLPSNVEDILGKYSITEPKACMEEQPNAAQSLEQLGPGAIQRLVDRLPPLHTWRPLTNPFARMYLLSCAYILLGVVTMMLCFLRPGAARLEMRSRLIAVSFGYVGVGFAFALLYHSIYIGQIAKYNSFLMWYLGERVTLAASIDKNLGEVQRQLNEQGYLAPSPDVAKAGECLKRWARLEPDNVLGFIRARTQTAEVFFQDKPRILPDFSRKKFDPVFKATFVFDSGSWRVRQTSPPTATGGNTALVDEFKKDLVDPFYEQPYSKNPVAYRVWLVGGADRNKRLAGFPEEGGNRGLAKVRAQVVRDVLSSSVPSNTYSRDHKELRAALAAANPDDYCLEEDQDPDSETAKSDLSRLWPNGLPPRETDGQKRAAWRAVGVIILKEVPDPLGFTITMNRPDTSRLEDMLYFSFVAFTTTGFGDVRPVSTEARFFAVSENILAVLFVTIFFVSALHGVERRRYKRHTSRIRAPRALAKG
jgi:hypothetical protein